MQRSHIDRLLARFDPYQGSGSERLPEPLALAAGALAHDLTRVLAQTKGDAFESALHLFPLSHEQGGLTLEQWNAQGLWRYEYGDLAVGLLCFGEDIFGNQFALRAGEVCRFEAETGSVVPMARDLEEWARLILDDSALETGYPLGHAWQQHNGALLPGKRLLPKLPFVLGGEYTLENLYAGDAVAGMRFRGNLAQQLRDLPDGAKVRLEIVD
ncbi:MAG: SMI1/KNR4 family protein [Dehalococcoidia bacterium]